MKFIVNHFKKLLLVSNCDGWLQGSDPLGSRLQSSWHGPQSGVVWYPHVSCKGGHSLFRLLRGPVNPINLFHFRTKYRNILNIEVLRLPTRTLLNYSCHHRNGEENKHTHLIYMLTVCVSCLDVTKSMFHLYIFQLIKTEVYN